MLTKGSNEAKRGGGRTIHSAKRSVVAAPGNKEGKHYGVQGSHSIVKQSAPKKHLYGMGGTRSIAKYNKVSHPHPEHKGSSVVAEKLK